jgi:crotonobetainyl-CoA:carnitine CoA-transferase CaiB-like acyl-CoA transferase
LHAANRDGIGTDCDVSLFDTALSMLTYPAAWALNSDFAPKRTHHSAHPSLVPFQAFPTSDGWIVVACPKEKFWRRLTEVLGRPEMADDPRFSSFAARREHGDVLVPLLEAEFATRTSTSWLTSLSASGVPSGPVNTVAEALADPHTTARGMLIETDHPTFGTVTQVSSAVRVGEEPAAHRRAPRRNEHADEVLGGLLGYSHEHRDLLEQSGAFGTSSHHASSRN